MNRHFILGLVAASWLSGQWLLADENPYTPIVARNVFGLVPIPIGPPADNTPAIPPPKITPNGIMTLFGKLQVLFKVAGVARPGLPPKDESYVMGEGERQDDIEVQKIDKQAAVITFDNHGTIQELPLVAGAASSGDVAPAAPAFPSPSGIPMPRMMSGGGGATTIGFGGRFGRARNLPAVSNPSAGGAPSFGSGGGNSAAPDNTANEEPMSPEAQVLMIEANRMATQDAVNKGLMPPLPVTALTPPDATAADGSPLIVPVGQAAQ